jgi:hypothetical protein
MECQGATVAIPRAAHFPPELVCSIATTVLNEHVNDANLRAICGSAWPCERVLLADHNLTVL